jgi:hypothetical protein
VPDQAGFYHRNSVHQRYVDVPKQAFQGGCARLPGQLRMVASGALSEALATGAHAPDSGEKSQEQGGAACPQGCAGGERRSCPAGEGKAGAAACHAKDAAGCDAQLLALMQQAFEAARSVRWACAAPI